MITDHALIAFACLFTVTLALGFWLGVQVSTAHIRRLKKRLEYAKLGL